MPGSRLWEQIEAAARRQLRAARNWCGQQAPGRRWVALFDLTGAGTEVWWPPLVLASLPPALTVRSPEPGFAAWVADWRQWPTRLEPEELGVEDNEDLVAQVNGRAGHWHETVSFFRGCFARAAVREAGGQGCIAACTSAPPSSAVPEAGGQGTEAWSLVAAMDDDDSTLPACLPPQLLTAYFPAVAERSASRQAVLSWPPAAQAAALFARVVGDNASLPRPAEWRAARRLVPLLENKLCAVLLGRVPGQAWVAAALLAEHGQVSTTAIDCLAVAAARTRRRRQEQAWALAALLRLGQAARVIELSAQPPADVVVEGFALAYSWWRLEGRGWPLDYAPLEQLLTQRPELAGPLASALATGGGYPTKQEEAVAVRAVASASPVVARHARRGLRRLHGTRGASPAG
ncbi:hypothetical protein [Buchananella hordeovulneris]|uniref:hypothetical protein n=1 Tax=Buchananella hordeovulneris TaxID=52770 RepID=UPI0026DA766D|nr:hypothetical protein [Buchananella hordeovulneris]MDO5079851.1 hypothetical protein [Buchananella hordeovulneris]